MLRLIIAVVAVAGCAKPAAPRLIVGNVAPESAPVVEVTPKTAAAETNWFSKANPYGYLNYVNYRLYRINQYGPRLRWTVAP